MADSLPSTGTRLFTGQQRRPKGNHNLQLIREEINPLRKNRGGAWLVFPFILA
jgi:hypothetical protein